MKTYLLDTSAYSQLVRGHSDVAKIVQSADKLYISLVTLAELQYGFACGSRTLENKLLLMKFTASRKVKTLIPAHETVHEFARVGSEMKKAGRALSHHDLWIATQAIQNNLTLVTYDKDFIHVKDAGIKGFKLQFLKV